MAEEKLNKTLLKAINKWYKKATLKAADYLRGNHIKSRSGSLYGSLKKPMNVTMEEGKIKLKLTMPYYATYIDGFGKKKWMTRYGRISKIPTNFLRPFRELSELLEDMKDEFVKYTAKTTKEELEKLNKTK